MIPLFKPYMPDIGGILDVLNSGQLTYGNYTQLFEKNLQDYLNEPYVMVTNSFHTAITVALTAMGIGYGDEVIASPMACLASTQPYLTSGIGVRWADIDPNRGTLLPESVEKNISSKTRAIVHNHFCGYPGYIDEINAIGKKFGIPVIDDGIECFGSIYKGNRIGHCGTDVTIFSLTAVRIPNCIDGGAIVFKNREAYEKALLARDCGIDRKNFRDEIGEINPECDISMIGQSATMSNVNGYIGLMQMKFVDNLIEMQRKQAQKWNEYFVNNQEEVPINVNHGLPNYWVYGILAKNKKKTICEFREKGYYASGIHIRNDLYSVFEKSNSTLIGVTEFNNKFVGIPCGWWMDDQI